MTDATELEKPYQPMNLQEAFGELCNQLADAGLEENERAEALMAVDFFKWSLEGEIYSLRKVVQQKDGIIEQMRAAAAQMKSDIEGMRYARDEWKRKAEVFEAQAKGKITDEWRRRVAAGEEGEVE